MAQPYYNPDQLRQRQQQQQGYNPYQQGPIMGTPMAGQQPGGYPPAGNHSPPYGYPSNMGGPPANVGGPPVMHPGAPHVFTPNANLGSSPFANNIMGGGNVSRDTFTQVRYRKKANVCERISSAAGAMVIGAILICAAFGVLFWNEGRAVQTSKSLDEGYSLVEVIGYANKVEPHLNRKLVFLQGQLGIESPIEDREFGLRLHTAKLERKVEMYQWQETKTTQTYDEGDAEREETTVAYKQIWSAAPIDSTRFQDSSRQNPTQFPIESKVFKANNVKVGAYRLSPGMIEQIDDWKVVKPSVNEKMSRKGIRSRGEYYYYADFAYPQVGDLRVQFRSAGMGGRKAEAAHVSVIGQQTGANLRAFQTKAGDLLEMLQVGRWGPEEMFSNAQSQNTAMTWGLRLGGWLMMWLSLTLMTELIVQLVSWIPLIGSAVALGRCVLTVLLATTLSLITIAVGWISYRPWFGAFLLTLAAMPMLYGWLQGRARQQPKDK